MRVYLLVVALAVICVSCSPKSASPTPSATVTLGEADLAGGVLTVGDMGKGWTPVKNPQPDTFVIGGKVGTSTYIHDASATKTVSFTQDNASGFVTNTVFVLPTVEAAKAVIDAHSNQPSTWRQSRTDGGFLDAKLLSTVQSLSQLGDDTYSARVEVTIKPGNATQTTKRTVEYVAYRIGNVLSFVVAQDVAVAPFAKKQESRLQRIIP